MIEALQVDLGARSYPIFSGPGLLDRGELLAPHLHGNQVCIVSNETVAPLYLPRLQHALSESGSNGTLAGLTVDHIVIPDGEQHKTLATYADVIDQLMRLRHNRTTTLIALGGGVVGDITGFVAATFQRGVGYIQVPTTLLAQVDSAVGGKTGVNHPQGKNMIGAFYQPECVVADTDVLSSLPRREYLAGMAEIIKYGVIRDGTFFDWLEDNLLPLLRQDPAELAQAIRTSCAIKADVVAADEREAGLRAILNFGHTFGHAIESLTGYQQFLHGEAVALGMVMAMDLSYRQGRIGADDAARVKVLIGATGLPVSPPRLDPDAFLAAMGMDKKVIDGRLRLILADSIGEVTVTDTVAPDLLRQTLTAYESLCDG